MKRTAFIVCLCAECFLATNVKSNPIISFTDTSLVDTSHNQTYNSRLTAFGTVPPSQKPLSDSFKLASVYFVTDNRRNDLIFNCNDGWHLENGACTPNVCNGFPYVGKPTEVCSDSTSCLSGDNYKYACQTCKAGWDKDPLLKGKCIEHSCDTVLYPYSIRPDDRAGTIATCQSGNIEYYGYNSCFEGWSLSAGKCIPNDCSGFPYQNVPDETAGLVSDEVCRSEYDNYYKYASCNKGWEMAEGKCNLRFCDNAVYPNTECLPNANCNVCFSGNDVKYSEPSCHSGYELKDGICVESCKYTSTSMPSYCASALSCLKNETTYFGCQNCQNGWFVNSSYGCSPNVCTGYDTSGSYCSSQYGTYSKSCQSGSTTYCSYSSCNASFSKQNGKCLCSGSYAVTEKSGDNACSISKGTLSNSCSDAEGKHCNFSSCNPRIAKYQNGRCDCLNNEDIPSEYVQTLHDLGRHDGKCLSFYLADGSQRELCSADENDYYQTGCMKYLYNYHFTCPDGYYAYCDTNRMCACVRKLSNGILAQFLGTNYSKYTGGSSAYFISEHFHYKDDVTYAACYNFCQSAGGKITSDASFFTGKSNNHSSSNAYLLFNGSWGKGGTLSYSLVWQYKYGATADTKSPAYHCYSCGNEHSGNQTMKARCVCDIKTTIFKCGPDKIRVPGSNVYGYTCLCDTTKYPYTSQPNTANGTVITCSDENGTKHYGYSQCLNGLTPTNGKCE